MCTDCLSIPSNSKRYKSLVSRSTLTVPCGHCPECISQAQDDWFLRCYQEIRDYNTSGGAVVYMTLTYNNWNLPVYTDVGMYTDRETGEVSERVFHIPCFSKAHKDKYMNSLLKWFERRGVTGQNSKGIRFIWPSEYGMTENCTHRPHYHPLLFIPKEGMALFKNKTELAKLLKSFWHYGFVHFSDEEDGGMFVTTECAGRYVTKYVVKDLEFFSQPEVNDYLYDADGNLIKDRWERFKPFAPHHWQSQSFGLGLVDYCENDDVFRDGLNFKFKSDIEKGKRKIYKVPRYIERKLLYKVDSLYYVPTDEFGEQLDFSVRYDTLVLNDRGKDVKTKFGFDYKLDRLCKLNADLLQNPIFAETHEDIRTYLNGHSIRYFSAWQLSFPGTCFSIPDSLRMQRCLQNEEKFVDLCRDLYYMRIQGYTNSDSFYDLGFYYAKTPPKYINFDDFYDFSCFNKINVLLLRYRDSVSRDNFKKYLEDKERRKKLKLMIS